MNNKRLERILNKFQEDVTRHIEMIKRSEPPFADPNSDFWFGYVKGMYMAMVILSSVLGEFGYTKEQETK